MMTLRNVFGSYKQVFCLCLLISCNLDRDIEHVEVRPQQDIFTLKSLYDISIPIDTLTRLVHKNKIYNAGEETYYVHYNDITHSIDFYNIEKKGKEFGIQLQKEGPSAIDYVLDFTVNNTDSVFVLDANRGNKILLLNSNGEIKKVWSIDTIGERVAHDYDITTDYFYSFTYDSKRKSINFWAMPYIDELKKKFYSYPLAVEYTLTNNNIENYGSFPASYKNDNCYYLYNTPGRETNDKVDIIHFMGSHNLYVYDRMNFKLKRIVQVKEKGAPSVLPSILKFGDDKPSVNEQRKYNIETPAYHYFKYDPYRNIYYRVFKDAMPYEQPDGSITQYEQYTYTILILDSALTVVGSFPLEGRRYSIKQFQVVRDGLMIGLNNSLASDIAESEMRFKIFSIDRK